MVQKIRLSEASAQATAALAAFDSETLQDLSEQFSLVAEGQLGVVPEPTGVVRRELLILESVLAASERNIRVLQGLRERKARNEWAL